MQGLFSEFVSYSCGTSCDSFTQWQIWWYCYLHEDAVSVHVQDSALCSAWAFAFPLWVQSPIWRNRLWPVSSRSWPPTYAAYELSYMANDTLGKRRGNGRHCWDQRADRKLGVRTALPQLRWPFSTLTIPLGKLHKTSINIGYIEIWAFSLVLGSKLGSSRIHLDGKSIIFVNMGFVWSSK